MVEQILAAVGFDFDDTGDGVVECVAVGIVKFVHGFGFGVGEIKEGGGVLECPGMGGAPEGFKFGGVVGHGEEVKDAAAVIVEDHDDERDARVGEESEAVEVVECGQVAEGEGDGAVESAGEAGGGGDGAVDAAGAPVGGNMDGVRVTGGEAVHIADGHGGSEEKAMEAGHPAGDGAEDTGFGDAFVFVEGLGEVVVDFLVGLEPEFPPGRIGGFSGGAFDLHAEAVDWNLEAVCEAVEGVEAPRSVADMDPGLEGGGGEGLKQGFGEEAGSELQEGFGLKFRGESLRGEEGIDMAHDAGSLWAEVEAGADIGENGPVPFGGKLQDGEGFGFAEAAADDDDDAGLAGKKFFDLHGGEFIEMEDGFAVGGKGLMIAEPGLDGEKVRFAVGPVGLGTEGVAEHAVEVNGAAAGMVKCEVESGEDDSGRNLGAGAGDILVPDGL